jgi:hypothetical protein
LNPGQRRVIQLVSNESEFPKVSSVFKKVSFRHLNFLEVLFSNFFVLSVKKFSLQCGYVGGFIPKLYSQYKINFAVEYTLKVIKYKKQ